MLFFQKKIFPTMLLGKNKTRTFWCVKLYVKKYGFAIQTEFKIYCQMVKFNTETWDLTQLMKVFY
jgi:hypothetical protein